MKEYEMDIFKKSENTWVIQTKKDAILIVLDEGVVEFFRETDVSDIS